jgi:hypothetical protein
MHEEGMNDELSTNAGLGTCPPDMLPRRPIAIVEDIA